MNHETEIISVSRTRGPPRLIIAAGSKDKSSCYNGSFVCGGTSIIGSNFLGLFHPLNTFPSSLQITTSLRTTFCWTRPWSTKGSNRLTSELFRWSILVRRKNLSLCCHCGSRMNCCYNIFYIFYPTDLPLKITYPLDFSDSRHYGLLLVMYVSYYRVHQECRVHDELKFFCSDITSHTESHKKLWWTLSCEQLHRTEGVCIFNVWTPWRWWH